MKLYVYREYARFMMFELSIGTTHIRIICRMKLYSTAHILRIQGTKFNEF